MASSKATKQPKLPPALAMLAEMRQQPTAVPVVTKPMLKMGQGETSGSGSVFNFGHITQGPGVGGFGGGGLFGLLGGLGRDDEKTQHTISQQIPNEVDIFGAITSEALNFATSAAGGPGALVPAWYDPEYFAALLQEIGQGGDTGGGIGGGGFNWGSMGGGFGGPDFSRLGREAMNRYSGQNALQRPVSWQMSGPVMSGQIGRAHV